MKTNFKVELLYRKSRYGSWLPCLIHIPENVESSEIKKYCEEDLKKMGIKFTEIRITKKTNK